MEYTDDNFISPDFDEDEENREITGYEDLDGDDDNDYDYGENEEIDEEQVEPYYMEDMDDRDTYTNLSYTHNNNSEFMMIEIENKYQEAISKLRYLINKYQDFRNGPPGIIYHSPIPGNVNNNIYDLKDKLQHLKNNRYDNFNLTYLNRLLFNLEGYDFHYVIEIIKDHLDPEFLDELIRTSQDKNTECPITQDNFKGEKCMTSCCNTNFSKSWLIKWIIRRGNCPICKSQNFLIYNLS